MRLCMLYKLDYGHVVADGMLQLIPMSWTSRQLNSNAYKVPYSRTNYHMNSIPLFLKLSLNFCRKHICFVALATVMRINAFLFQMPPIYKSSLLGSQKLNRRLGRLSGHLR